MIILFVGEVLVKSDQGDDRVKPKSDGGRGGKCYLVTGE